jgi:hypothetical protein
MNALYTRGFGMFAPRYACEMLKKIAGENGGATELARIEKGFLAEMRRLTNVFTLTDDKGWQMLPLHEAQAAYLIDEEEAAEIDNAVVFFTCASRSHLKSQMDEVRGALSLWNARTDWLGCTEFANSLRTLTVDASTGETASPS